LYSSILSSFVFWSLLATKLQKYENSTQSLHFERQDGQDRKQQKENHATKVIKIPKNKRQKYGMNDTLVIYFLAKYCRLSMLASIL
jgi:hypothetical protein